MTGKDVWSSVCGNELILRYVKIHKSLISIVFLTMTVFFFNGDICAMEEENENTSDSPKSTHSSSHHSSKEPLTEKEKKKTNAILNLPLSPKAALIIDAWDLCEKKKLTLEQALNKLAEDPKENEKMYRPLTILNILQDKTSLSDEIVRNFFRSVLLDIEVSKKNKKERLLQGLIENYKTIREERFFTRNTNRRLFNLDMF